MLLVVLVLVVLSCGDESLDAMFVGRRPELSGVEG